MPQSPRFRVGVLTIFLTGVVVTPYGIAQSITDFNIPTADSSPQGIAAGPDGALWFTERTSTKIGRITASGVVTEFPVPAPSVGGGYLGEITRGPDGAMWFGEVLNIGRIDMAGNVTHFRAGGGPQAMNGITAGPDGALWFTQYFTGVGRLDPTGAFSQTYSVGSDSFIWGLAFDREGQFWVTVSGQPSDFTNLRRVTPAGHVTSEFTAPNAPTGITSGPDGAMWFTSGASIGRIVSNGAITTFLIPTPKSGATDIISGPDGALWFTESTANKIGRITTDGAITEYPLPAIPAGSSCEGTGPGRITAGPDGGFWFTEPCLNRIGHLTLSAGSPPVAGGASPPQGTGTTGNFTFTFSDASGWQNIGVANVLINSALDGRRACYLAYAVASSSLVLVDDAGDAGGPYSGSVTVGNPGTVIENSQCAVSLVSAVGSGSTLTLTLAIRFQPGFGGNLIEYLAARDVSQNNSGWQASGVWNASSQTPPPGLIAGAMIPGRGNDLAGTAQTISFSIADPKGVADIGIVNLLVNNFIDGRQACYLAYVAATHSVYLVDDAGDAGGPFAGSMVLNGASGTIQNSQCSINAQGSSVVASGNQMTLTFAITFLPTFAGNRILWIAGRDTAGANNTGWQAIGTASISLPISTAN